MLEINQFGTKIYKNEQRQLHREDGPAVEYANGEKYWYINGLLHREDGPAVEYSNGTKFWYINGRLHREDGPAIEWTNGTKFWYIDDIHYDLKEYHKKMLERSDKEVIIMMKAFSLGQL